MQEIHALLGANKENIMKTKLSSVANMGNIVLILTLLVTFFSPSHVQADGETLDPTFGTHGIVTTDYGGTDTGNKILLQSDGKIITLGFSQLSGSNTRIPVITRYNANGAIDNTFGVSGKLLVEIEGFSGCDIEFQPNGKLIVAGTYAGNLAAVRYSSNGSGLDNTFGADGIATTGITSEDIEWSCYDLAVSSNGKFAIVGTGEVGQSVHSDLVVGSFNEDGTLNFRRFIDESSFDDDGIFNNGSGVAIQTDGKVIVSGYMQDSENVGHISLARINDDSSADTTFGNNGKGAVKILLPNFYHNPGAILLDANGKITVAGFVFADNDYTSTDLAIARINPNGTLDTNFNGSGITITDFGSKEIGNDIILQPDGKVVMVGSILNAGSTDTLVVRYNSNGTLDTSFGTNGKIVTNIGSSDAANSIIAQTDGKIIIVGQNDGNAILARYNLIPNTNPTTSITFKSKGAQDGLILETTENSNKGGTVNTAATTMNVGDNQKDWQYRGFLSFNTTTLPDNALITSALLTVKRQGLVGLDPFTTSGDLLVDISNKAFGTNATLLPADFNAAATPGSTQEKLPPTASAWYSVNLSNTNLAFINKYGITQFRLHFSLDDNDNLSADYLKLFTGEAPAASQPQLIITYSLP
jgi:uncharacterized delta-60 repeat protein